MQQYQQQQQEESNQNAPAPPASAAAASNSVTQNFASCTVGTAGAGVVSRPDMPVVGGRSFPPSLDERILLKNVNRPLLSSADSRLSLVARSQDNNLDHFALLEQLQLKQLQLQQNNAGQQIGLKQIELQSQSQNGLGEMNVLYEKKMQDEISKQVQFQVQVEIQKMQEKQQQQTINPHDSLHDQYVKNRICSLKNRARIDWDKVNELIGSQTLLNILQHIYVLNNLIDGFKINRNFCKELKAFISEKFYNSFNGVSCYNGNGVLYLEKTNMIALAHESYVNIFNTLLDCDHEKIGSDEWKTIFDELVKIGLKDNNCNNGNGNGNANGNTVTAAAAAAAVSNGNGRNGGSNGSGGNNIGNVNGNVTAAVSNNNVNNVNNGNGNGGNINGGSGGSSGSNSGNNNSNSNSNVIKAPDRFSRDKMIRKNNIESKIRNDILSQKKKNKRFTF